MNTSQHIRRIAITALVCGGLFAGQADANVPADDAVNLNSLRTAVLPLLDQWLSTVKQDPSTSGTTTAAETLLTLLNKTKSTGVVTATVAGAKLTLEPNTKRDTKAEAAALLVRIKAAMTQRRVQNPPADVAEALMKVIGVPCQEPAIPPRRAPESPRSDASPQR